MGGRKSRSCHRIFRAIVPSSLLIPLSVLGAKGSAYGSKQDFVEVAYIPEGMHSAWGLEAGDTDHDGLQELLFSDRGIVMIYEHVGSNEYELVLAIGGGVIFWTAGDADSDGLSDMVVETSDSLKIFESAAPDSYPTRCVWRWEEPDMTNPSETRITDLDQDGRKELLVVHYGYYICMLENVGDNTYAEVFRDTLFHPPYGAVSEATPGDFDLDGRREYVTSDGTGNVWVFENIEVGVDSFALTWQGSALTTSTAYENASANDMDRDGKPEFVIGGSHPMGYRRFVFTVFETTGDDEYELVWCDSSITSGLFDGCQIACGDVDGDSIDEMLFGVDEEGIFLYKCTGPDSYERIWEWHTMYGIGGILIYDLNQKGYGEIVVSTPGGTWIFEKELPGVNEMPACPERSRGDARLMQNHPNPFSRSTTIPFHITSAVGGPRTADNLSTYERINLSVYDLSGRLVRTLLDEVKEAGAHSATWDARDHSGRAVSSGVYLYRFEVLGSKRPLTRTRKMLLIE